MGVRSEVPLYLLQQSGVVAQTGLFAGDWVVVR